MYSLTIVVLFLACLPLLHFLTKSWRWSKAKNLPPGSMGIPVIGQSLSLLRAMGENRGEEWVAKRIDKYGTISKLHLFGTPSVILAGPAANKFVFTNLHLFSSEQPKSLRNVFGDRSIPELMGEEHKRVRGAISQFLKVEVLKKYVGEIDSKVRDHLDSNWIGRQTVTVLPSVKSLTFNVICSLIFGIEEGSARDELLRDFMDVLTGIVAAVPLNLPFTNYSKCLKASKSVKKKLTALVKQKRDASKQGSSEFDSRGDLISYLLSLGEKGETGSLTDDEIVDNAVFVMIAGHDTSSILISFMIRHLANDPTTLSDMIQEQEEIAKSKAPEESLTWDDLSKMKFTWRVAMETLRMVPPVFGSFRRALKDVEFNGYIIPKGWQVFWAANITHMDTNIFPDPSKFDPMRFENQSSIPPYSFVAFGGGPRICPGYELARIETLVMMHYVVTRFSWKLCDEGDAYWRDPMPSPLGGGCQSNLSPSPLVLQVPKLIAICVKITLKMCFRQ